MSKEDDQVTSPTEKLYSIGPDLAGIVDYYGRYAFETWDGGSGDVFACIGRLGHNGIINDDDKIIFDLPSIVGGGGKHRHTPLALYHLREAIVNFRKPSPAQNEERIKRYIEAEFVALSGNRLKIEYHAGLSVDLVGRRADKYPSLTVVALHFCEPPESEPPKKFFGIINGFYHLAEAIQEDNRLLQPNSGRRAL